MKNALSSSFALAALQLTLHAAAFVPGNLVIYRVGDGTAALAATATAVFLDEYTPSGSLVQSIALPTAAGGANLALTASGTSTSEGMLNRSADGTALTFTGYSAIPGTTVPGAAGAVARTVGVADSVGNINTSTSTTSFTGSNNNIRSVASLDGLEFWLSGSANGVVYTTLGASGAGTIVANTFTNLRGLDIFAGQLYVSSGASSLRLGTVGSGAPTTTGQTITNLPGFPTATTSPYQFVLFDLDLGVSGPDTVYIADDAAGAGIEKYSLVGGSWALNGTISGTSIRGLTASATGSTVSLFTTSATALFSATDSSGYNAAPVGSLTSIATAGANTAFRGLDFAPVSIPEPSTGVLLVGGLALLAASRRRRAPLPA